MSGDSTTTSGGAFPRTRWSLVVAAGGPDDVRADEALSCLCELYWFPIYAFARRRGKSPEDARDLTQGFLAHMVASRMCARAEERKGRFRNFLLGAFEHYLVTEHRRATAEKRGGGQVAYSFEAAGAESRLAGEGTMQQTPEALYDRLWAMAVLEQALRLLEAEQRRLKHGKTFDRLHPFLQGDREGDTYARIATDLGTTEANVKVTVLRLRRRYRELVRSVILETVTDPAEAEEEMRHLIAALRGGTGGGISGG